MMYILKKPQILGQMINTASRIETRLIKRHYKKRNWEKVKQYHNQTKGSGQNGKDRDRDIEMQLNTAVFTKG
jgi:hypothetical protein